MSSSFNVPPSAPPPALASADELLDALPWGVLALDAQRTIRRINQQAAAWCGAAPDALLGQPLAEAPLPPALGATLRQLLDAGAATPHEVWLPDSQQWLSLRTVPAPTGQHWVFWEDVTARHQAEADRQRSSQLLLDMEAVAHTGSYAADLRSGSFYFSDGLYRLFGEAPQSFVPTQEFINARSHPDDVALVQQVLGEAVRTQQPYTYRHRIQRAAGEWRTLEAHGEVRADAAGHAVQLRGLVQDITERLQAEDARHESRALLRATIDSSLDMVQVFEAVRDEQGVVVDFAWVLNNAAAERHYGNVLGQRLCQLNPGVVAEGIFDTFRQVLATGVPDQREHHYVHEQFDGWFYQSTVQLGDGIATTTRDITERKQAHAEILQLKDELAQQATDRYRALFYSMSQGFCLLEILFEEASEQAVDFRYLEVNPMFAQESGLPADVQGKTARQLLPELDAFWVDTYRHIARTGEAQRLERYSPELDRWFDVHAFRMGPPEARQVGVLFSDVTARKQAEQHQQFLLQLADALRPLADAREIQRTATRVLGEYFGLDRAMYAEITPDGKSVVVTDNYLSGRFPAFTGSFPLSAYGPIIERARHGEPLIVEDVDAEAELTKEDKFNYQVIGSTAFVTHPLLKGGRWVANLVVHQGEPRRWTSDEIALLRETAERTWAAVERARAEEALRTSEEQFRTVANLVPDLLWRSTPASDTTWYNAQWYAYTGQTPEDAAGYGWTHAIHPDDRAEAARLYQATLTSGQFRRQEHRIRSAQGEYRWFQVQVRPVRNEPGEVTAWFGAATDIHARKLSELHRRQVEEHYRQQLEQQVAERTQQLQASHDLLQSVLDTSLVSMSVLEAVRDEAGVVQDFRLRLVNQELARATGRTDLVGKLYAQEYPGIRQVGIFDLMLQALATGEPQSMEYFYGQEGLHQWFACQFVKLGDGVVATSLDITERKTAEQERLKSLRLLEQAEAVAGLGSWDYDLATGVMRWSAGMYQLLGLPLGQPVEPDSYLRLVVEEDRARATQAVHCLTTGADFEDTLRLRVGEHVKTVRLKAVVLPDAAGRPARMLGVDLDISELQRLEADNLRLHLGQQQALFEAVQATQETERKRMAESLHNGIGQILYATKLRLDRLHAPILGTHAALVTARREADQLLSEAIRQTRALSHELVPLVLEEFGLAAALQDISRKMSTPQLHLRSHVLLDPAAAPLAPPLQMALYRMAQELAQNIVKHAHGATEASLELETTPGWALLRAEDNGPGFSPAAAARPGLGLRSILDRVALLGGRLESGAALTGGAYVRIRIPLPPPATLAL